MTSSSDVIEALGLPTAAVVDKRIAKTLLLEHATKPTAADKRAVRNGLESLRWVAVLKPETIGIDGLSDEQREYLEISVLEANVNEDNAIERLSTVIHRAIPYPTLLVAQSSENLSVSGAHQRRSLSAPGSFVLDGSMFSACSPRNNPASSWPHLLSSLAASLQPKADLRAFYQGWLGCLLAHQLADVTEEFDLPTSETDASSRHEKLMTLQNIDADSVRLRNAAAKTKQARRQVEINMELARLRDQRGEIISALSQGTQ